MAHKSNLILLAAFGWIMVMGFVLFNDGGQTTSDRPAQPPALSGQGGGFQPVGAAPSLLSASMAAAAPPASQAADAAAFAAPYDDYVITQGPHGFSYGHLAIDLTAGKGAVIKSPINGSVTNLFVDQWGNPNLVLENDVYRVTLLHGEYTVRVGDPVVIGQPVGLESNIGYTKDWAGNLCTGRDCGYHTHLNVYDKRSGANIDPTPLLNPE